MVLKFLTVLFSLLLFALQANETKALYNSLDPKSLSQALAFYELYPETEEGRNALKKVCLQLGLPSENQAKQLLPKLINRIVGTKTEFNEEERAFIETLASHLPNKRLKGYKALNEKEILKLPPEEIDLGKALLLSQLEGQENALEKAENYSALLDLMALQILTTLSEKPTFEEKIAKTNEFIFEKMHFRFPPQSIYAEKIDLFTFLPSVMDNHLGVCLGVTALYLSLAQRLDLPLEIITPPGHIYVRYHDRERLINIETTARGVDLPSETYLSVNTCKLKERNIKEVVGMTHFNQASVYLHAEQFEKAAACYEKALPYLPDEPLVKELLGYSYLLSNKTEEGKQLLQSICHLPRGDTIQKNHLAEDYLKGKVDLEGLRSVFMFVDETRNSILAKQKRLQKVLQANPEFRDGLSQLAISWIQLNRAKEAIQLLKRYHEIDAEDPVTEYYLAVLHAERHDYKSAWHYLKNAEVLCAAHSSYPKALKELRRELLQVCP